MLVPLRHERCESRQARKGATVTMIVGDKVGTARVATNLVDMIGEFLANLRQYDIALKSSIIAIINQQKFGITIFLSS